MSPSCRPCLGHWSACLRSASLRLAGPLLALLLAVLGGAVSGAEALVPEGASVGLEGPAAVALAASDQPSDGAPPADDDPEGSEASDGDGEPGEPGELEPGGEGDAPPAKLGRGAAPVVRRAPGLVPLPAPCTSPELPCATARQWRSLHPSRGPPRA
jgi:hypothetical protein